MALSDIINLSDQSSLSSLLIMAGLFLYGLIFGSFFNVVGLRIPLRQSIIHPPSHCPKCQRRLPWYDLLPVISYLYRKGRCGSCQTVISAIYPLVELMTGILFACTYAVYGWSAETVLGLLFVSLLVIITVSDIGYQLIPDRVLLPFFVLFLVLRFWIHPYPYWVHLIGMVAGFTLFLLLAWVSRGGMGGGDIKLVAVIGLFLAPPLLITAIFLSSLIGVSGGLTYLLFKGKGIRTGIPFGPFLALGSLIAYFFGEGMLEWYFGVSFPAIFS
nr:A24 family peptidase [Brevibacillus dissolubilis]